MLLLDLDSAGDRLVQGFVRARWPRTDSISADRIGTWARLFQRSATLWKQCGMVSAALRVEATPGEPLVTVHSIVAPKAQETRVRLVLAAFSRTHGIAEASTEIPHEQAELAGRYVHIGDTRIAIAKEVLRTRAGARIRFNFRLVDHLVRLIEASTDLGFPFAYEAQATAWSIPRPLLREALIDAGDLAEDAGVPKEIAQDQAALAARLRRSTLHVEECLAAASPEMTDALITTLTNQMDSTVYATFGATPVPKPLDADVAGAFAHHVHSHILLGEPDSFEPGEVCAAATKDEVEAILCCRVLGLDTTASAPAGSAGEGPLFSTLTGIPSRPPLQPSGGGIPAAPRDAAQPFMFVSYARNDSEHVYPFIAALGQQGVTTWIDRSIIGGDQWPAVIEQQLLQCVGVLAMISPSFVDSHYCPREVVFADALRKPIVPIFLAPAELKHGLGWLLTSHNRIMLQDHSLVLVAIKQLAPLAYTQTANQDSGNGSPISR